ncbi:unnamed protein product [Cyprideis torosa]|uniref:Carboxylic ester hydrolase n=1 Tax=Cyprideis torosa TaxID=163714 RepID=A0A7R8ZMC8_9CRUS|nr:unnamed protein product [Cyprideis torosa]CAG0888517.1 unnamed protein product [Cyprideis torosa]
MLWYAVVSFFMFLDEISSARIEQFHPEVTLSHGGTVRGVRLTVRQTDGTEDPRGAEYYAFRDIFYAEAPVRFTPPTPHPGWNGTRDGTQERVMCIQRLISLSLVVGQEDCLVLHVFVPVQTHQPAKLLSVMVNIHGGGFVSGTSMSLVYGPDFLMAPEHEVILVNINYRLGAFGFLSTGDKEATGNWGLLDQVEALKWIQKEISAFGGDPGKVTVFGQSAGGTSVSLLRLSPLSRGLFHRAIAQSGMSALSIEGSWKEHPEENALKLAQSLQCPVPDPAVAEREVVSSSIVECLRQKPAKDIAKRVFHPLEWQGLDDDIRVFLQPVVDGVFLQDSPSSILEQGKIGNPVPSMMGSMEEEFNFLIGFTLLDPKGLDVLNNNFYKLCTIIFDFATEYSDNREACRRIKQHFLGDGDATFTYANVRLFIQILNERFIEISNLKELLLLSKRIPTYHYMFDHVASQSLIKRAQMFLRRSIMMMPEESVRNYSELYDLHVPRGAEHGDDLAYLFSGAMVPNSPLDSDDSKVSQMVTKLWTTFAHKGSFELVAADWKPWTREQPVTYMISSCPRISYIRTQRHLITSWEKILEPKMPPSEACQCHARSVHG